MSWQLIQGVFSAFVYMRLNWLQNVVLMATISCEHFMVLYINYFPLIHLFWLGSSYSSMCCCAPVRETVWIMLCPGLQSKHVHGLAFAYSAQFLYLEINVIKTKHNKEADCGDANHCTVTPLVLRNHVHLSQISSTLLRCGVTIQSDLRKITSTQPHWQISSKLLHSC